MKFPYDQSGVYAIHIAGRLDASVANRLGGLTISTIEQDDESDQPVTILKGCLPDQAALFGVLTTLYNWRYPLLFVRYLRPNQPCQ
ncbi:MAG: hypothetical protein IAF02_19575 [Anaerolineae bacterium]|nr:hypothetical protein [Anaerolineae bacterium]